MKSSGLKISQYFNTSTKKTSLSLLPIINPENLKRIHFPKRYKIFKHDLNSSTSAAKNAFPCQYKKIILRTLLLLANTEGPLIKSEANITIEIQKHG